MQLYLEGEGVGGFPYKKKSALNYEFNSATFAIFKSEWQPAEVFFGSLIDGRYLAGPAIENFFWLALSAVFIANLLSALIIASELK